MGYDPNSPIARKAIAQARARGEAWASQPPYSAATTPSGAASGPIPKAAKARAAGATEEAKPKGPNRTELEHVALHVEPRVASGELLSWSFEPFPLVLAKGGRRLRSDKGAGRLVKPITYTLDIGCLRADGRVELHEAKGEQMWEDSWIKFKLAVELFGDSLILVFARKKNGLWKVERSEPKPNFNKNSP